MKTKKETPRTVGEVTIIKLINRLPDMENTEDMVNTAKTIQYVSESIKSEKTNKLDPNVIVPIAIYAGGSVLLYGLNYYLSGDRVISFKGMDEAKRFLSWLIPGRR